MEPEKIARINHLARKAKEPGGLTPQEKEEQERLRREYVEAYRRNLVEQLEHTHIQYPDGRKVKLRRKEP